LIAISLGPVLATGVPVICEAQKSYGYGGFWERLEVMAPEKSVEELGKKFSIRNLLPAGFD